MDPPVDWTAQGVMTLVKIVWSSAALAGPCSLRVLLRKLDFGTGANSCFSAVRALWNTSNCVSNRCLEASRSSRITRFGHSATTHSAHPSAGT